MLKNTSIYLHLVSYQYVSRAVNTSMENKYTIGMYVPQVSSSPVINASSDYSLKQHRTSEDVRQSITFCPSI